MQVVVGDEQLGKLAVGVVPLTDVVQPGHRLDLDAGGVVQFPDEAVVVVGQQELAFHGQQGIPQADVVPFREAVLTDVLVIPLCGV